MLFILITTGLIMLIILLTWIIYLPLNYLCIKTTSYSLEDYFIKKILINRNYSMEPCSKIKINATFKQFYN